MCNPVQMGYILVCMGRVVERSTEPVAYALVAQPPGYLVKLSKIW